MKFEYIMKLPYCKSDISNVLVIYLLNVCNGNTYHITFIM